MVKITPKESDAAAEHGFGFEPEASKEASGISFEDKGSFYILMCILCTPGAPTKLLVSEPDSNSAYNLHLPKNVEIWGKMFILWIVAFLTATLQLLPLTILSWFFPGALTEGVLSRKDKTDENENQTFYWIVYFGLPFFMLFLDCASKFIVTTHKILELSVQLKDVGFLTAVRAFLLTLSVVVKAAVVYGILTLAYVSITADQAIAGPNEGTYPPVLEILTNVVALDYLLGIDNNILEHLIDMKFVNSIDEWAAEEFAAAKASSGPSENGGILSKSFRNKFQERLVCVMTGLIMIAVPIITVILTLSTWTSECPEICGEIKQAKCSAVFGDKYDPTAASC